MDALEGKGPQRRPQRRLGRRLEEVAEAVGGGYCRLQMPLKLALGVRETSIVWSNAPPRLQRGGGAGETFRHPSRPTVLCSVNPTPNSRCIPRNGPPPAVPFQRIAAAPAPSLCDPVAVRSMRHASLKRPIFSGTARVSSVSRGHQQHPSQPIVRRNPQNVYRKPAESPKQLCDPHGPPRCNDRNLHPSPAPGWAGK